MSDQRPWSVKGVLLAILAVAGLSVYTGCGKVDSSNMPVSGIPTSAIVSLEATGPRGTTSDGSGKMTVRAQSRDLLEVVAQVTGITRELGFFIAQGVAATGWGTWQGGVLSTVDGFTYYPVDEVGVARGVLVAGTSAGRQDIIARYMDWQTENYVEARLSITFNMGTMSIFPSTIVLNNDPSIGKVVEVRGALPPVEWWVSHPDIMGFHIRDATSIMLFWINAANPIIVTTLPAGGGVVTARDAEGQEATAIVYMLNDACFTGILTVSPNTGPFTGYVISIEVTDLDLIGTNSITVDAKGGLTLDGATTVTLNSAGNDGYFYGDFVAVAPAAGGGYQINYRDESDAANQCLPNAIVVGYYTDY